MKRTIKIAWAVAGAAVLAGVFSYVWFDIYIAATEAMEPTIAHNERLLAQAHFTGTAQRGDIVIVQIPGEPRPRISRVVAVAGDTIEGRDGIVWLNGEPLIEPYVAGGVATSPFAVVVVPPGHIYLLSDNRPLAKDSRFYGPVPEEQIEGKVVLRLWPIGGI